MKLCVAVAYGEEDMAYWLQHAVDCGWKNVAATRVCTHRVHGLIFEITGDWPDDHPRLRDHMRAAEHTRAVLARYRASAGGKT